MLCVLFFFFKQKTAYEVRISDWSSDVCSSDLIEEGGGAGFEFRALLVVGHDAGAREVDAALFVQHVRVDRRRGAGGGAEQHHHTARLQALERAVEGVVADCVIAPRPALAVAQILHALNPHLIAVLSGEVTTVPCPQRWRLFRSHCSASCPPNLG